MSGEATSALDRGTGGVVRTVVFIVWPERGHIAVPVTLAKHLRERGDRVVFAGVSIIGERIRSLGFEFFELAKGFAPWEPKDSFSVFWAMPPREQFRSAVDELLQRFGTLCEQFKPSLIAVDSLYSILGILAEAAGIAWLQYETDLPREFDPAVPPSGLMLNPAGEAAALPLRQAWAAVLHSSFRARHASRQEPVCSGWSMSRDFPDALIETLRERLGSRLRFERRTVCAPVARAPRLVFCPRAFDFQRSRPCAQTSWVGACLDEQRSEPSLAWDSLQDRPLVYCSLGTQSLRNPQSLEVLRKVVATFSQREDLSLIVACHRLHQKALGPTPRHILVVDDAPQWSILGRACLAITHAGFNTIKECVANGVPMIAIPLSHDQPRNAALIEFHRLGVAIEPPSLEVDGLNQTVTRLLEAPEIRANVLKFQRLFRDSGGPREALRYLDALMVSRADGRQVRVG